MIPHNDSLSHHFVLSQRQADIFRLHSLGLSTFEIALLFRCSHNCIVKHRRSVYKLVGTNSLPHLTSILASSGYIDECFFTFPDFLLFAS